MIYSMTAFARKENQSDIGYLTCEIRSINHRYLEVSLYLPEVLRALEMPMREYVRSHINRGKVECTLKYQLSHTSDHYFQLNKILVKELCVASETIAHLMRQPVVASSTDILRYPGVLEAKEIDTKVLQDAFMKLMEQTLKELIAVREREGNELNQLFLKRIAAIQDELEKVKNQLPGLAKTQREKLLKRFSEANLTLDPGRLEQEMLLFLQKIDVSEEIERTETHLNEMQRILHQGGVVGRRLDFLLQELNREANTLGSKSTDSIVTHAAVEMKVLIEQVREQVQNVE
ncbi:MAG: YicC family protein [Gammaproteobacteria bacterium RIFCSPHIGHO2_12_FULL_38_14]|nr:MAG: YicC family protein [Gammaproteobacteria bacterium RIFCSPHIGHO2_12_FULL_38_14]